MDTSDSTEDSSVSRRAVLRKGGIAATAGAFAITTGSETVAASELCPRSAGYWTNHWRDKLGDQVDIPPAGELSKSEIQSLLGGPTKGDKVNILARQYLATYLDLFLRPDPDTDCANEAVAVDGIGTVEWEHVKNSAQHWLRHNSWDGTSHTGKRSWTPSVEIEGADEQVDGEKLKDALDEFNNNRFDDLDCNCGDEESSSGGSDKSDEGNGSKKRDEEGNGRKERGNGEQNGNRKHGDE